jgi:hypothetical protein
MPGNVDYTTPRIQREVAERRFGADQVIPVLLP